LAKSQYGRLFFSHWKRLFQPFSSGVFNMKTLWLDESGAILSVELILLMVILVIGLVVGLTALRDSIDATLASLSAAVAAIDPGYGLSGLAYNAVAADITDNSSAWVAGSAYNAGLPAEAQSGNLQASAAFTAYLAGPGTSPYPQSIK
jgi:hypothetical protein